MRRNKYGAVRTEYAGRQYASKFEAKVAADLEVLRRMGVVKEIRPQYAIDLEVNGKKVGRHVVDFRVEYADGSVRFVEAKGVPTALWKLKRAIVEALFPWIKYEVRTKGQR